MRKKSYVSCFLCVLIFLANFLVEAENAPSPADVKASAVPKEHPIKRIALTGAVSERRAEISGLAWYRDNLILLPQFAKERLYRIPKAELLSRIDGKTDEPLAAAEITLVIGDLTKVPVAFDGFEAIVFNGDDVYLVVESGGGRHMASHVVRAKIREDLSEIRLEPDSYTPIPLERQIPNMAYESLVLLGDQLVVLPEANGVNVVKNPYAHVLGLDLEPREHIVFPTIEYRVTDATEVDSEGRFWIINYFYQGDGFKLRPEKDVFEERYGKGASHKRAKNVERLVEVQYRSDQENQKRTITFTDTPPIQLEVDPYDGRNWEGIVRLDDRGFLIVTDSYPETILAFVEGR